MLEEVDLPSNSQKSKSKDSNNSRKKCKRKKKTYWSNNRMKNSMPKRWSYKKYKTCIKESNTVRCTSKD